MIFFGLTRISSKVFVSVSIIGCMKEISVSIDWSYFLSGSFGYFMVHFPSFFLVFHHMLFLYHVRNVSVLCFIHYLHDCYFSSY